MKISTRVKRIVASGATVTLAFGMGACSTGGGAESSGKPASGGEASGDAMKVGVLYQNLSNEWIAMLKDTMEAEAAEQLPGVEFSFLDGEGDPEKQITQMDGFISQKVDVIICNPQDGNALLPAVQQAIDAGIPVITLGSDVEGEVGQTWVGSANEDGGKLQLQFLVDQLGGKGDIAILRGPIGHYAEMGRMRGYQEVLDANPDINVVFDQSANFSRETGMSVMENWLQNGAKIDGVVAQNDEMILGAAQAVQAAGKGDEIVMVGLDGIPDALQAVKGGTLAATMYQDAVAVGEAAILMTKELLDGGTIERTNIPFELVTIDNVDEYIAKG